MGKTGKMPARAAAALAFATLLWVAGVLVGVRAQAATADGLDVCTRIDDGEFDGQQNFRVITDTFELGQRLWFTWGPPTLGTPTSAFLTADGHYVDTSAAASGTFQYIVPSSGTHEFTFGVSPGSTTWSVVCSPPLDGCMVLNGPELDDVYRDKMLDFPIVFQPGDTIRFDVIPGDGATSATLADGTTPLASVSPLPGQMTHAFSVATLVRQLAWTVAPNEGLGEWDVSCTRMKVALQCAPGGPVPSGYKLVTGTEGNDRIALGSGNQLVRALGGDDVISDMSGDDIVCGNEGDDRLSGGTGDDVLYGGDGYDTLSGGSGIDRGCDTDAGAKQSVEKNCKTFMPESL